MILRNNFRASVNGKYPPTKIAYVHTRARHIIMASFIVEAMVPGIHKINLEHNFCVLVEIH